MEKKKIKILDDLIDDETGKFLFGKGAKHNGKIHKGMDRIYRR